MSILIKKRLIISVTGRMPIYCGDRLNLDNPDGVNHKLRMRLHLDSVFNLFYIDNVK